MFAQFFNELQFIVVRGSAMTGADPRILVKELNQNPSGWDRGRGKTNVFGQNIV